MQPTAVTWAVLGLLALGPRSGYDIKRVVDRSIRHFWAASYGQIYPELKRLEDAGWIAGRDADRGGRSRRVYRITAQGRRELDGWLHGYETRLELRDESLLRLFFADTLPRDEALGLLAARREGYRMMLAYLRGLDDGSGEPDPPFVDLVYRWGLDYCEWGIEWCDRQERRLRRAA
jgi:DNA-binding PadR family transcriptional regulator